MPNTNPNPIAKYLIVSALSVVSLVASAQSKESSPAPDSSVRVFAVPLVYFSPDTYWAFGGAGILTFRGRPQRSSISFSGAYTQRKQILVSLPYQWFSPKGHWRAYGEVAWYRYLYQYFGIGNTYPNEFKETYVAKYPRVRINMLHRLHKHGLAGLRYGLDVFRILSIQEGGELASGKITGTGGGVSSAFGPVWLFDSRDNQFYPRSGALIESTAYAELPLWGSDFRYLRFFTEASRYMSFWKKNVLVLHFLGQATIGDPPFFSMAQMGGMRWLRGYPAGKFRDKHLLLFQTEWRFPLFWRFKGAMFAGTGSVFGTPGERLHWRYNAGGGIRFEFDTRQHIHLRLDYGISADNSGFYLTVGEAF